MSPDFEELPGVEYPKPPPRCEGCNGDGTRWVTVGTLVDSETTLLGRRLYLIEASA